jgi:hypothetical protein
MDIECNHTKEERYHYRLNRSQMLWLCDACELHLRKQIFKQVIIEREFEVRKI